MTEESTVVHCTRESPWDQTPPPAGVHQAVVHHETEWLAEKHFGEGYRKQKYRCKLCGATWWSDRL